MRIISFLKFANNFYLIVNNDCIKKGEIYYKLDTSRKIWNLIYLYLTATHNYVNLNLQKASWNL